MAENKFLTTTQICKRIPGSKGADCITISTVTRWIVVGCPSRSGERVKLAATRAGHRWLVRESDLEDFFAALRGEIDPTPQPETKKESARSKAIARADKELEAAGA